jgi:inosose dehydratase
MAIRVATAPVSWGVMEVEGFGGQKPFGEVLDEMKRAGYDGTELGPYGFLPTDPKALRAELSSRRLALLGAFVPLPLATPARHDAGYQEALKVGRLLADCGAGYVVLADEMSETRMSVSGRVSESDGLSDPQWRAAAALVSRTAAACGEMKLRAVFHHHVGTYVETPQELERLCALTDPDLLGICFDTGHYYYGGGDPVEAVRKYRKRIRHLHFKDVRPNVLEAARRDKIGFLDAVRRGIFCELGEGGVDLPAVVRELNAAGFDGWSVFEQDVDPRDPNIRPFESAARSRKYLRDVIGI